MNRVFEIGPFQLDADAGVLTRDGTPCVLGPRAVAVLTTLVEHSNQYVSKASIIDAAWPGLVVEEGNLAVQIAAIRRVFAQTGGQSWIETLARRGYRFVGPLTARTDGDKPSELKDERSNLPEPTTSFIGRERELVEVKRLLPTKRLVTIVGAGGIGKTRLALRVAAEVIDAYHDGVWLAELGSIRDPALVPTSVAQAVRVQERPGVSLTESLRRHFTARQVLLVLDNCEHLLDACAQFAATVLAQARRATIIATSREPLRVEGEQVYALQPLSLPERGSKTEIAAESEAVQLFVERVQEQLPGFELTPERAQVVAEVCIHLDGIPLALELAAARGRSLSVEQINARLGERFRLLTAGSRTALPRQQTLRATLDWSYDLLTEDERLGLRRLSIFPGSFSVEAASAVVSEAATDEFAVIDILSQLVARSLVIADTSTGRARYGLLETTRAYAAQKLDEVGETDACRRRHAEYFAALFDRSQADWVQMSDAEVFASYVPELAHVRAALDWALGPNGDVAIGIALAGSSGPVWMALGLYSEGARRLDAAVARIEPRISEPDQARLWHWLGRILDDTPAQSQPALKRAVELYRRLGDALGLGLSLVGLGKVLAGMGRFEEAEAVLTEARLLLERAGPPRALGPYFFHLAWLKSQAGDPVAARKYYEMSLTLDRQAGNEFGVLATLGNLANVTWALGDLEATEASFRRQVALVQASPSKTNRLLGWALTSLAGVLAERGELAEALVAAREGMPLLAEDGSAWPFLSCLALRAGLAGKLSVAARIAGYADQILAAKKLKPHPIDIRLRKRLDDLLRKELPVDELERLFAEGARMSEDEACEIALKE